MNRYILAIDQSTAGTKTMLLNSAGAVTARCDIPHRQIVNEIGWVEHDPNEIFANLLQGVKQLLEESSVQPGEITAAAVSNQRETTIVWDNATGEPLYNAIVWQCARGEEVCKRLAASGASEAVRSATGIPLSPYYSAAKIAWVLENVPQAKSCKTLCCSTMDSWLVYKLCGGTPKTDYSNASRSQLMDIRTLRWSEEVAGLFGIDVSMLPEICDSNSLFGHSDFSGIFPTAIPIHAVLGDSHGALFGQGCLRPGEVKATYGTGSSIMMNIGEKPVFSDRGIVTSLAWSMDGKANYVLEGNINCTGAVIKWLVEDLQLISSPGESGLLAKSSDHVDGLYLIPAFTGLGAPYWDSDARAMLCGMTRNTGKAQVVRAAEECIAYQIADILFLMKEETHMEIPTLRVDGGPTRDDFLMQFQADIIRSSVQVAPIEELSGAGAAYAAGLATGFYSMKDIFGKSPSRQYNPRMEPGQAQAYYHGWQEAIKKALTK